MLLYNVALLSTEQQSESAMHMYRLHFAVQKATQHCKATVLQLKVHKLFKKRKCLGAGEGTRTGVREHRTLGWKQEKQNPGVLQGQAGVVPGDDTPGLVLCLGP